MTQNIDLIRLKRGASANVTAASLQKGEPAVSLDKKELWVGDGTGKIKITDIYFYNNFSNLPATGEEDKLYIIKDTGSFYIWDSSLPGYKKYEIDITTGLVYCRARGSTQITAPASYQNISYPTNDLTTEPARLYQDPVNQDRFYAQEEGYYKIGYGIVYDIPLTGGAQSDVNATINSRIMINDVNPCLASYNENTYNLYYVNRLITDTLINDCVEWLNVGDYVTVQVQGTGDPIYVKWYDIEIFKIDFVKGDKGDPGTPGSIWYNGSGIPLLTLGDNNDYYQNNDNGDVYHKQSDTWNLISNIKGVQGDEGPQGPAGEAFKIDEYDDIDEAKIAAIESGSGASPSDLYYFLVLNDNRSNQNLPNTLTGDITRHVIMYDGITWTDFGPFTGLDGPEGPPGTDGNDGQGLDEQHYAESETEQQTTNNVYDEKLKLTTSSLSGGTYRVSWYYEWRYSSQQRNFRCRIQVDDATNLAEHAQEPKDAGGDIYHNASGFKRITLSPGVHTIDLDWCSQNLGDTATIRRARLELWKTGN